MMISKNICTNTAVTDWVRQMADLTKPDQVIWLDGSDEEYQNLLAEAVKTGQLIALNPEKNPRSYLHCSDPQDVARTEKCTFICTLNKEDAGPTNNWMSPDEAYSKLNKLFSGIMKGKKMYVIPYLMGPKGSAFSKVGFELTDSLYVAINMRLMTRMGQAALDHLGNSSSFIKGLHSVGNLDPQNRFICHFPQDLTIYSINSGYGGNALLSKKCFALRIASWMGKNEGWLAEHMLIAGIEDPQGRISYIAAAFPSACGKTNLAMLKPTGRFKGYKVWSVGDDIAWLRIGSDGRLYATNPEAGFFGVAPGTNENTNPNMMTTISHDTIFTNVALAPDKSVWWEGLPIASNAAGYQDWQGKPWAPSSGQKAAHPNSRFTVSLKQCPIYSKEWDNPEGVPISAIIFGARRSSLVPLVYESFNWQHGVYLGATMASETTAAAAGDTGVLRRDPMAMLPFCGYNMADYFRHWLDMGKRMSKPPKIFRVNWFRVDEHGHFVWPGFSENMRVLKWVIDQSTGQKEGTIQTPIGLLPTPEALEIADLHLSQEELDRIFSIDKEKWLDAVIKQPEFFSMFGNRLPREIIDEQQALIKRLKDWEPASSPV